MSAIIEAAARALYPYSGPPATETRLLEVHAAATAVLAAVTPLIRAQVLEEAAQVAEDGYYSIPSREEFVAAIRALKEQP
jgi:hypothetical protein